MFMLLVLLFIVTTNVDEAVDNAENFFLYLNKQN